MLINLIINNIVNNLMYYITSPFSQQILSRVTTRMLVRSGAQLCCALTTTQE